MAKESMALILFFKKNWEIIKHGIIWNLCGPYFIEMHVSNKI